MKRFEGFPPGKTRTIALPTLFFNDLLPLVDDLAELKVTLFAFYAVQQREGKYRYMRLGDFLANEALVASIAKLTNEQTAAAALIAALDRACARGTLLCVQIPIAGQPESIYFINAEPGRIAARQITAGKWQPGEHAQTVELVPERPNIFQLYEENIGALTGIIADHLKDAERDYAVGWVEEAIQLAVEHEKRSWKYIQAILERWRKEGKHEVARKSAATNGQRSIAADLDEFIRE
ncbi:MAG: DnaD domain protein [Anaerolineae bacterium]|nr:DnaD domain protein [Anaerolineae bacterium]